MIETPRCSVVIPTFNGLGLLRQCLDSLGESTDLGGVEVVVVDNGSTDGTAACVRRHATGARVVVRPSNEGFARACNRGADAAAAELLLFLNNDTILRPGWLEPLLGEMAAHPDVGIVGSRLLYADGTVQHAGVAFSRPLGVPYHFARGAPPDHPLVCRRRELKAVTGACLLIRRSLFEDVGGFDTDYVNGFEDVDLCLKVRRRGQKVVYQPRSTLTHLEEQTPQRKDHDTPNLERLLGSWPKECTPDETRVLLEDGFVCRSVQRGTAMHRTIAPLASADERARWERVAEMERRIETCDVKALYGDPPVVEDWPEDPDALLWGSSVCRGSGLPFLGDAFERRARSVGESSRPMPALREERGPELVPSDWLERALRALEA